MRMSNPFLSKLVIRHQLRSLCTTSQFFQRTPFGGRTPRTPEERYKVEFERYKRFRLKMVEPIDARPQQWKRPSPEKSPTLVQKERKLTPLHEESSPYQKLTDNDIKNILEPGTYYDPLFNPHLHEGRNEVDPNEEPFNAIYVDSHSADADQYTKVRDVTTPELWSMVESLKRTTLASELMRRKNGSPPVPLPSGFIPPYEDPPDLPYFVSRTRNNLLPVYYHLATDQDKCITYVNKVMGDLWKFEEDVRTHLESLSDGKRRILTSVQETDERVVFRGRHLHEIVGWLHEKGF